MPDTPPTPADAGVRRSGDADDQITLTSQRPAPNQIVIEVGGEVDMLTSPQLRATVLEQFEPGAGIELVVLGMDGVTFLGTSGLAVLIEGMQNVAAYGGKFALAALQESVRPIFEIARLDQVFQIYPTVDAALAA